MTPTKMVEGGRVLDRCVSTNDVAKNLAEAGCPHGTWISSRIQDAGRGRLGRKWTSGEGNLFLSVILRIQDKSVWSWTPLATGAAVVRCLRALFPEVLVQIKWPNDLWLQGAKMGGILCEGTSNAIIAGIGLNCTHSPEGLDREVIDLTTARKGCYTHADQVRLPIVKTLLEEIQDLETNGPSTLIDRFSQWSVLSQGTKIQWDSGDGLSGFSGSVLGLGPVGELRVLRSDGLEVNLYAEDVKIYSERIR